MSISPLGRYSAIGALIASLLVLVAAVATHVIYARSDSLLDTMAVLALGILLGQSNGVAVGRQEGNTEATNTINGLHAQVNALHRRADLGHLPAAPEPAAAEPSGGPHA